MAGQRGGDGRRAIRKMLEIDCAAVERAVEPPRRDGARKRVCTVALERAQAEASLREVDAADGSAPRRSTRSDRTHPAGSPPSMGLR